MRLGYFCIRSDGTAGQVFVELQVSSLWTWFQYYVCVGAVSGGVRRSGGQAMA
jgi:hypothetical protein